MNVFNQHEQQEGVQCEEGCYHIVSVVLVEVLKVLSFGDRWWDVTVAVSFPASIIALVIGIIAVTKYKERSILVILSIIIGVCTLFFIPLHSLFIND